MQRTDEENYIHIGKNRMGCSSKPGMRGGRQLIRAGDCQTFHLVHEIMHALGNIFLYLLDNLHHLVQIDGFNHLTHQSFLSFQDFFTSIRGSIAHVILMSI